MRATGIPMDDHPTILVIADYAPEKLAQLKARFDVHQFVPDPKIGAEVTPAITSSIDTAALRRARALATDPGRGARAELIGLLPRLEIISSVGVGLDRIDLAAARERGIAVTNTPDILTDDVADLAIGLLIAAARGIVDAERFVRDGRWMTTDPPLRQSVTGKTIGILGLGRIGRSIARRAEAFSMTVLYTGTEEKPDIAHDYVTDPVELAARSDFLVVSCKGGPETAKLVDAEVLAALGPAGILVNVARGSVVDEDALIAALRAGALGFAALDVFATEPDVSRELLALPNVLVQPHHGSATVDTRNRMAQLAIDNLIAHMEGRPLLTPVLNGAG